MSKSEVRKEVLKARQALSPAVAAGKSALIIQKLLVMEEYLQAAALMVYLDFRNEVQTGALVVDALGRGKQVAVPITDVQNRRLIPSLLLNYPDDLAPGTWGILEPKPECVRPLEPAALDLVIVPGVAFDLAGNRLGYGGGFYDRFLPHTRTDTVFVSLAFELQLRPKVYPGEHDYRVHFIITEDRVVDTRQVLNKNFGE